MHAHKGDRIVIRSQQVGGRVRDAKVLEVQHEDGSPPYWIRWSDSGLVVLFFPGSDAYVDHLDAATAGAYGRVRLTGPPGVWRA